MKKLKTLTILALLVFIVSCKQDHNTNTNTKEEDTPIRLTLLGINFTLNNFSYSVNDTIVSWYYPYEVVFLYEISNDSQKEITLVINDTLAGKDNYYQAMIRHNESPVECDETVKIKEGSKKLFNCYIMEIPIFDSIYSRKEFANFISEFQDNLNSEINIIKKGIEVSKEEKSINFCMHDKFYFHFYHWKNDSVSPKEIGFPIEDVPDTIKPIKPTSGIEW